MSRSYKKSANKGAVVTLAVVSTLVVIALGITITGLCMGHTSPIKFVLSWFGK